MGGDEFCCTFEVFKVLTIKSCARHVLGINYEKNKYYYSIAATVFGML